MCQSMKKVSLLGKSTFVSAKVDQKCWIECEKGFEWQSADPDDDLKVNLTLLNKQLLSLKTVQTDSRLFDIDAQW